MSSEYILLALGWIVYYALHSLLASNEMKLRIALPVLQYRLGYSLLSVLGLLGMLYFNARIGSDPLLLKNGIVRYGALILAGTGVLIARAAFRNYSIGAFIGFKKEGTPSLVTSGINAWVRHPLYTATILITAGFFLFDSRLASLVSVAITWIYLFIGIRLEERKLIALFGADYLEYRENVAAVIPFIH